MLGMFSDGGWKVGRTVSRQILHCLGGQCFSLLGGCCGSGCVCLCLCWEGASSSKAPGTEWCLAVSIEELDAEGMFEGQCHSGWGLKPVEVILKRRFVENILG